MAVKSKVVPAETNQIPPMTYGVWIEGRGWLRSSDGRWFADPRIEYAKTALGLINRAGRYKCHILLFDQSLASLQDQFLEEEKVYTYGLVAKKEKRLTHRVLVFIQKVLIRIRKVLKWRSGTN
jgi:hypothetical protein